MALKQILDKPCPQIIPHIAVAVVIHPITKVPLVQSGHCGQIGAEIRSNLPEIFIAPVLPTIHILMVEIKVLLISKLLFFSWLDF